jgi:hypothetical protein
MKQGLPNSCQPGDPCAVYRDSTGLTRGSLRLAKGCMQMKRNLVGTLTALTLIAAWLAPTALANGVAGHMGGFGDQHASAWSDQGNWGDQGGIGDGDCDRGDQCGNCPPGSTGGDYCECPPGSEDGNCQCPPNSQGDQGCDPDQQSGGAGDRGGSGNQGWNQNPGWCQRWMWHPGGGTSCFGFPTGLWFRIAGAPQHARR